MEQRREDGRGKDEGRLMMDAFITTCANCGKKTLQRYKKLIRCVAQTYASALVTFQCREGTKEDGGSDKMEAGEKTGA